MSDAAAGSTGTAAQAAAAAAAQAAAAAAAPGAPAPAGAAPSPANVAAAAQAAGASPVAAAASAAGTDAAQGGQQLDTTGWPQEAVTAYEKAKADATRYQREAGDSRINAKRSAADEARAQILADLTKVLDPTAATTAAPTVEGVTQQLTTVQSDLTTAKRTAATVAEAWAQGIDPGKLGYLQYQLSTDATYGALDPTAPDFGAKLTASIAALAAQDATLKLPGGAVASGVESLGGAGGATAISPEAFAAMSIAERTNLYKTDKAAYDKLAGNAS